MQAAFQKTRGVSPPELASPIAEARDALRTAAGALSAIRPPADVEADNAALAAAMRAYADELEAAVRAAAAGDREGMARFGDARTSPAVQAMAKAAERMKEKGYKLGPIAKD